MARSRHIYWWPITIYTGGANQNNVWAFDGTDGVKAITISSAAAGRWDSIYELAAYLQTAIRAEGGNYASVTVTVEFTQTSTSFGHIVIANPAGIIAPSPTGAANTNFDILIGGDGSDGTPAASYTMPNPHEAGIYLNGHCVQDTGDQPIAFVEKAQSLNGSNRRYDWGNTSIRTVGYELLSATERALFFELFTTSPGEVILISDPAATFADTAANYIVENSDMKADRLSPGQELYSLTMGLEVR